MQSTLEPQSESEFQEVLMDYDWLKYHRRKSIDSDRKDFMTQLLDGSSRAQFQISDNQLAAHMIDLV